MAKEYRTLHTTVDLPYELAFGATLTRFFDGLSEEKILGTRCPKCGRVLVPARSFCPRCFIDLDQWVEVGQMGTVETWSLVSYRYFGMAKTPPYITALIRLDGADVSLTHLVGGIDLSSLEMVRTHLSIGTRVKAVWAKEKPGSIFDIEYFVPVEADSH
jgi:hypothetical protein